MTSLPVELLGWVATAVFVASYFFGRPNRLVQAQILGALLWTAYGVLMRAPPVVAANVLVIAAAAWKMRRVRNARGEVSEVKGLAAQGHGSEA